MGYWQWWVFISQASIFTVDIFLTATYVVFSFLIITMGPSFLFLKYASRCLSHTAVWLHVKLWFLKLWTFTSINSRKPFWLTQIPGHWITVQKAPFRHIRCSCIGGKGVHMILVSEDWNAIGASVNQTLTGALLCSPHHLPQGCGDGASGTPTFPPLALFSVSRQSLLPTLSPKKKQV